MSLEHHWAGAASLRLQAIDVVPGFAQLVIKSDHDTAESWSGLFFSRDASERLQPGAAAELLLPGDIVGRATLGDDADGVFALDGVLPWAEWPRLVNTMNPAGRQPTVTVREGYLEASGPSQLTPENWVRVEDIPLQPGQRLLLDYRPVQAIFVPFDWFLAAAEQLDSMGVKVAVVANSPMAFGISRQAIQTAGIHEGSAFNVFRDIDEARTWLLADAD